MSKVPPSFIGNLVVPINDRSQNKADAFKNLHKVTNMQVTIFSQYFLTRVFRGLNELDQINNINSKNGILGRNNDYLNNTVSYANKNGKSRVPDLWNRRGSKPDFSIENLRKSNVRIQSEMKRTFDQFKLKEMKDQERFDQTDKPIYPLFETEQKNKVLGNFGWGINNSQIKYKTAHPQKGLSIDREHLKFLDHRLPSNFKGHPTGFSEPKPDKILFDLSPQQYHLDFPSNSRIPLGSLEMQRQTKSFQQTQQFLHKQALIEKNFNNPIYQKGIVSKQQIYGFKVQKNNVY